MAKENILAVVSSSGKALNLLELSSGKRVARIKDLIPEPHEICVDLKRNLLYISHPYLSGSYIANGGRSQEISVVDLTENKVVDIIKLPDGTAPHGLKIDESRDVLYTSVESVASGLGGLLGIDLSNRNIVKSIAGGWKAHWLALTLDGKKAFLANKEADFVSVLDLEKGRMTTKITVSGSEEPDMSKDGKYLYVPTPNFRLGPTPANTGFQVIDTANDRVVHFVKTDQKINSLHVTSRNTIMVALTPHEENETSRNYTSQPGRLELYNAQDYSNLGSVEVGLFPLTMRSSADGLTGFVANVMSGTVSVVDLKEMAVVKIFESDLEKDPVTGSCQGAHGMALLP